MCPNMHGNRSVAGPGCVCIRNARKDAGVVPKGCGVMTAVAPVVVAELSLPAASNTLIPNLIPTCDGRALMGRRETNQ